MSFKSASILLLLLVATGVGIYYYLKTTYPTLSPLVTSEYYFESITKPHIHLTDTVIGFLPYWQLDQIPNIRPQLLTEINYFSLSVGDDGHILKNIGEQTEPGWRSWQSDTVKDFMIKAHILGAKNTVTIAALNDSLIDSILASQTNQQNFISDVTDEVKKRNLDGVIVDFEYTGIPTDASRNNFVLLSKNLKAKLLQVKPDSTLSLTLLPMTVRSNGLFLLPNLRDTYDQFIGMSYDYYAANAQVSGPSAPLGGYAQKKYFFDVTTTYDDILSVLPRAKVIMGVPTYGWERTVHDGKTILSKTYPSSSPNNYAAIMSFARGKNDPDLKKSQCSWDELAQETWCWFTDKTTGLDHQVWLADTKSIGARLNYAKKRNLAGVALWTLGYDKDNTDLWDLLNTTFSD